MNDTSVLCNNSNTNYTSIREYLKEECKYHISDIYIYIYIYMLYIINVYMY